MIPTDQPTNQPTNPAGGSIGRIEHGPTIRRALVIAFRSFPPLHSVHRLAQLTGCHERTLQRQWRAIAGEDAQLRIEDILGWLLLVHAAGMKAPGNDWSKVATTLKVEKRTIWRWARRLLGRGLRELEAMGSKTVLENFMAVLSRKIPGYEWSRNLE